MSRSSRLIISLNIFILLTAFFPCAVHADSILDRYFSGSSFSLELSEDSISDTNKMEAELDLRFRHDDFSAFVRLTNDRPFAFQTEDYGIEKRGFNFELNDDWEITGGDYSLVFARGTVLNAIEDRPVDKDFQLDGVMIEGGTGNLDLTAFWGTHRSNRMDYYLSGINTDDGGPSDELMGARLEMDFDDLDLGASWIDADMTRYGTPMSTVVTEFDASWKIDNVTLYYETAWFNREEPEGVEDNYDGRAQLAEFIYAEKGFSLNGSWVRYNSAHFDYGTAPSLRRYEIDDSEARPDDETGYRLDCRMSPSSWNGNLLRVLYADLNGIENKNQKFRNYFLEWSSPATKDWTGSLSYDRIAGFLLFYGAIDGTDTSYRATLDGPFMFGGTCHIYARYRKLANEFESDDEVELGFDWHVSPEFTIGVFRETSTCEMEPPPPGFYDLDPESPGHWNSAFIRWTPDSLSEYELLIGSRRGGFQCSGGTCTQVPPFKGIMFMYYRNF